jgi:hypothetical protein
MSQLLVDDIVNKDDTGPVDFTKGVNATGIVTASSFVGDVSGNVNVGTSLTITASGVNVPAGIVTASAAGGALATTIDAKASTGKAIAMSMVFG